MSQVLRMRLDSDDARFAAASAIMRAPAGWLVTITPETRTQAQNRLLHPLLTDLSHQATWMGRPRSMLQWKTLTVSGHAIATGEPTEMTVGLEGEVVNLRESTAQMSTARFSSLVEYVLAWGTNHDVRFTAVPPL